MIFRMLTFSIVWLVLAVAVTVFAIMRRKPLAVHEDAAGQSPESGHGLLVLAVVYGVALLAGFVLVSRFFISTI